MKLLKILAALLTLLAVLGVGVGFLLPRTVHVERSTEIFASPKVVFTVLNGFRQFNKWSPWADIDPNAVMSFEGPETGVGAKMSWSGNADVGTGSQEILDSEENRRIVIRLGFGDFAGEYRSTYTLEPTSVGTRLTWAYDADFGGSLIARYFGLLSESLIAPDYERGLLRLKALVEGLPVGDFSSLSFEVVQTQAQPLLFLPTRSAREPRAIGVALGVAYGRISGAMNVAGLHQAAPPRAIFHGEEDDTLVFDAAIPIDRPVETPPAGLQHGRSYAGRAVKATYTGPYMGLPGANAQALSYLAAAGYAAAGPRWEEYVSDPGQTPDAELITHLYYPIE